MSLTIITGSMFGGKTTKIIEMKREIEKDCKNKILVINHLHDNRYSSDDCIITHNNEREVCKKTRYLSELNFTIDKSFKDFSHIFIDEGQFFHEGDLLLFVRTCLFEYKQHVIVSGLICNANLGNLGGISCLMRYADDIIFLKGRCNFCQKENSATCTYVEGVSKKNSIYYDKPDAIVMDKLETYKFQPSCKLCWMQKTEKIR